MYRSLLVLLLIFLYSCSEGNEDAWEDAVKQKIMNSNAQELCEYLNESLIQVQSIRKSLGDNYNINSSEKVPWILGSKYGREITCSKETEELLEKEMKFAYQNPDD